MNVAHWAGSRRSAHKFGRQAHKDRQQAAESGRGEHRKVKGREDPERCLRS